MLETERLILRPLVKDDVDAVYAMRRDAAIMRFIREPQNLNETIDWIELVSSRWKTEKIGFCAMIEKEAENFLGWCGIWKLKETDDFEIGYATAKSAWKKGFATEAALEFLKYGFENLDCNQIAAVARPENTASIRVMEKLGMSYDYTGLFYGKHLVHYSISRETFGSLKNKIQSKIQVR